MLDYNADDLSDQDIEKLAEIMANKPKLVSALSKMLDEKFGFQQGWMSDKLEAMDAKLDVITQKLTDHDRKFDAIDHKLDMFGEKLHLVERSNEKTKKRVERDVSIIPAGELQIKEKLP